MVADVLVSAMRPCPARLNTARPATWSATPVPALSSASTPTRPRRSRPGRQALGSHRGSFPASFPGRIEPAAGRYVNTSMT